MCQNSACEGTEWSWKSGQKSNAETGRMEVGNKGVREKYSLSKKKMHLKRNFMYICISVFCIVSCPE